MPNLALCNYVLPGGHLCRQPRLRDGAHCRFHVRNNAIAEHYARMDQLQDELEAMDLSQLLTTLSDKLDRIQCTLRSYPEARLTLMVVIDRLNGISPIPSMIESQPQQNESSEPKPRTAEELWESVRMLMTCSR